MPTDVVAHRCMERGSIVPHPEIPRTPAVATAELRLLGEAKQIFEHRLRLRRRELHYAVREDAVHVETLSPAVGMNAHDRVLGGLCRRPALLRM